MNDHRIRLGERQPTVLLLLLLVGMSACAEAVDAAEQGSERTTSTTIVVEDKTQRLRHYPCTECHGRMGGSDQAHVARHPDIRIAHFSGAERCVLCHDTPRVERLRLLNGETVSLSRAAEACGQCHAEKRRDWDIGAHGKHVGSWSGTSYRLSCPDCHDPHAPRRAVVRALPAPPRPKLGIVKGREHD